MPKLLFSCFMFVSAMLLSCGEEIPSDLNQSVRPAANSYPSWIPLAAERQPAGDLVYQGAIITSEKAQALREQGIDLATLDPDGSSDIWNSRGEFPADDFSFTGNTSVNYRNGVASSSGNFRFIADDPQSRQSYEFVAAVDAHSILLRAGILRRLGYRVPKLYHVKQVTVNFANSRVRELFEDDVTTSTTKSFTRWLKSRQAKSLVLQDLIVYDAKLDYYNLAIGNIPASVIGNRRLLRSLVVPYSLMNVGESIKPTALASRSRDQWPCCP